jgi:ribosome-binding factor A
MSIRTERVGEEIQRVIAAALVRGLRDPLPGFVTVAKVEVTTDFSHAKVWVSVIGTDAEKKGAIDVLTQNKGALRYEVGKKVKLRNTPELHFHLDESGERAARVWALLDEDKKKHPPQPSVEHKKDEPTHEKDG